MAAKDDIIALLNECKRPGMNELIAFLAVDSDYFTAPSSTKYHGNYSGGLIDHSLNVFDAISLLNDELVDVNKRYDRESLIIVALLHDLCKVDYYIIDDEPASSAQIKYVNDLLDKAGQSIGEYHYTKSYISKLIEHLKSGEETPIPEYREYYKVDDTLPMGHGEKSVFMIQKYIDLSDEEALAIRWHLGGFDPGFHFFFPSGAPAKQALRENTLVPMLISADFTATWLIDKTVK